MRGHSESTLAVLREMEMSPEFKGTTNPPTLAFLGYWTLANSPKRVLQLGTLMGYSALVIADALEWDGHLWSVDTDARKLELAEMYARKANLDDNLSLVHGNSLDPRTIDELRANGPYDLIYLDTSHEYFSTCEELRVYAHPAFMHSATMFILHDTSILAQGWDVTRLGGVRKALAEFETIKAAALGLRVAWFDPPLYADTSGMALVYHDTAHKP